MLLPDGATYGGLDGIFANVDSLTPKLRENLRAHEEQVRLNAKVMVLLRDVPIDPAPVVPYRRDCRGRCGR